MVQQRDIRLSFNGAAEIYDAVRPSYPAALFDALFEMLPGNPMIVEVGPGTGQATRHLLARGAAVHAVEIGPSMAAKLRSNHPSDELRVSVGDFEQISISSGSADAVVSATAYHWISRPAQTDRPASILRRCGVLAIIDLIQVNSPDDEGFFAACQPIYERYGQGHASPPAASRDAVNPAIRQVLDDDDKFQDVAVRRWDWNQTYTTRQYQQLMLSYSGTQMMDDPDRLGLLADMAALINEHFNGSVTRPLVVTLTTAVLA